MTARRAPAGLGLHPPPATLVLLGPAGTRSGRGPQAQAPAPAPHTRPGPSPPSRLYSNAASQRRPRPPQAPPLLPRPRDPGRPRTCGTLHVLACRSPPSPRERDLRGRETRLCVVLSLPTLQLPGNHVHELIYHRQPARTEGQEQGQCPGPRWLHGAAESQLDVRSREGVLNRRFGRCKRRFVLLEVKTYLTQDLQKKRKKEMLVATILAIELNPETGKLK